MLFRVAEVFPVQADILLLHSLPEEGLVFPQHHLQTGAAEVSTAASILWVSEHMLF